MRNGVMMPLSLLALSVDVCWAIEPCWGRRALQILDGIDYGAHLVEYSRARSGHGGEPRADPEDGDGDDTIDDDRNRRAFDDFAPDRAEKEKRYCVRDRVATICLTGPMTKRPQSWGDGCATVLVRRALRQAAADSEVGAICLLIDSPGGQVAGTGDLAADVREASKRKPVMAYAEDLCCSAAYWVGSQAGAGIYCNATATVGSIGTLMVLEDTSAAAHKCGVVVHVVATGDLKGIGAAGAPITGEHLAYLRSYLDRINAEFTGAVLMARKLTPKQGAEVFRAGIFVGSEAVKMGLVDGVKSRDEVHGMLAGMAGISGTDGTNGTQGTNGAEGRLSTGAAAGSVALAPGASVAEVSAAIAALPFEPVGLGDVVEGRPATVPLSQYQTGGVPARTTAGTGEVKSMGRDILIRALKAFGLNRMAVAVVASNDDSPEALASAMSEQVNAEVADAIDRHEVVKACKAAGIHTAADLGKVLDTAKLGNDWLSELREDAKAQAIRAFGYEQGMRVGAQVALMPLAAVRQMRDSWCAQADAQFSIKGAGAGDGAQRVSAAGPLHETVSVTATGQAEAAAAVAAGTTAWSKLKPAHQEYALKLLGADASAEAKEKFAVQALKDLGE